MNRKITLIFTIFLTALSYNLYGHHNPIAYDGKKEVKISGIVTSAYFGNPHSRYTIDVTGDDGEVENWLLMTEDPGDARSLGFEEEIRNLKTGDRITVVGWPHRTKAREIRGHQLHYPDGRIVMMRRGNYIWRGSMRQIYRMVSGRDQIDPAIETTPLSMLPAERAIQWIKEDKMIPRIAFEVKNKTAQLFGLKLDGIIEFPGITELFECHTRRPGFTLIINIDDLSGVIKQKILDNREFINRYNATLARYYEQDIESC